MAGRTIREHDVQTADGRTLHLTDAGPEGGRPILVHHGSPGSGLLYEPWILDAEARGARLLSYDRPGYGGSTADPARLLR